MRLWPKRTHSRNGGMPDDYTPPSGSLTPPSEIPTARLKLAEACEGEP